MKPKEKAEMIMRENLHQISGIPTRHILMFNRGDSHVESARKCALFFLDEIEFEIERIDKKFNLGLEGTKQYWQEVKTEIEKL